MAFRLTYFWKLEYIGPGAGPMSVPQQQSLGGRESGGGQNSGTLAAADITTLTANMATDVAAQITAQAAATGQWSSGGP